MPSNEDLDHTMRAFAIKNPKFHQRPLTSRSVWNNRFSQLLFLMANQIRSFVMHLEELCLEADSFGTDEEGEEPSSAASSLSSSKLLSPPSSIIRSPSPSLPPQ